MVRGAERCLIWGGGGHGKVVADLARACGHTVVGYVDAQSVKLGRVVEPGGSCVVLTQDALLERLRSGSSPVEAERLVLAIGDNGVRLRLAHLAEGLELLTLVHPTAVVSSSASIAAGTVVFPGAIVNADARVGIAVIVNSAAVVEHDCNVGDGAHLSPGSVIAGGVRVGARAWVGAGAIVLPQVCIGADAVVGAGAVVVHDVADGATVVGNPARPIRS